VASTSLQAFSQKDTTELNLEEHTSIYIDYAPFQFPDKIISKLFEPLKVKPNNSESNKISNSRYWINLAPLSDFLDITRFKYVSFGPFERVIIYQSDGIEVEEVGRLGGLYKSHSTARSPHFTLFPIDSLDSNKEIYVQLSTGYKTNYPIQSINVQAYTNDAIQQKYYHNSHASTKGLIQTGLIFYLLLLTFGTVLLSFSSHNVKYLSFAGLCIALIIFYSRNLEVYYSGPVLWGHWDEAVIKWENMCRSGISISFVIFILVNFKLGPFKKYIYVSTAIISLLSIAIGIYSSSVIGPFSHSTNALDIFFLIEIFLSISNSVLLLYLVWRYNDGLFGKPFVYATLLFLISAYASIWLHTTWLGNLDSIFSSKMYSTYVVIIYLAVLSYLMVKYFTQRETHIQLAAQKNQQLRTINEAKSKLFADISHEFRTPLTIIQGLTEEVPMDLKRKDTINRSSQDLLRLVDELRDLSMLESSHLSLDYKQADFISYIEYLSESFHSLAEQKNINLTFQANQEELVMDYDEKRIRQIITNLISNAIHFTQENGSVDINITTSEDQCILSIKDNGAGISKSDQTKIFERYYSNHENATGSYTGTGIGLSLVEELVALMKGKIIIKSKLSVGSEFILTLPVHRKAPLSEQLYNKGDHITDAVPQAHVQYNTTDQLILIVEDNADISEYIKNCLSDHYKILIAAHGKSGFEYAATHIPDIIISDLMMPVMDGIELMKALKADHKTNHIPVIMLTAKSAQEDRELALSCGADSYLTKPFSKNELRIRIDNIMQRTKLLQEKYGDGSIVLRKDIPEWLTKLNELIQSELQEELNVELICKKIFMSRSQLHRKLKAITGQSISAYIKNMRMQKANQLLQGTTQSIIQIAHTIGYRNAGHFATDYKKIFGMSPSEMR